MRKNVAGTLTTFIWDGDQVIFEADSWGNVLARYGLIGSQPIYVRRGSDTRYYVQQNVGSVSGMFNGSGWITHTYQYYPFGQRLGADTLETFHNPLRFAGQYFDQETGMYYMRARYYDPPLLRFISEDPLGLGGGLNSYEYAAGDPVTMRDPSGLIPIPWIDICLMILLCINGYDPLVADAGGHDWSSFDDWVGGIRVGLATGEAYSLMDHVQREYGGRSRNSRGRSALRAKVIQISYKSAYPERAQVLQRRNCPMPQASLLYGWDHGRYFERTIVRSDADVDRPLLLMGIGAVTGGTGAAGWFVIRHGGKAVGGAAVRGAAGGAALAVPQGWLYEVINCGHGGW